MDGKISMGLEKIIEVRGVIEGSKKLMYKGCDYEVYNVIVWVWGYWRFSYLYVCLNLVLWVVFESVFVMFVYF